MPIVGSITPKPPVTHRVYFELSDRERAVWTLLLYRLKDGMIVTGLSGDDLAVLNNTFSGLYDLFLDGGYVEKPIVPEG